MSVEIEPQDLSFQRPFTQEVSQILKIKNTGRQPLAFKVKTTAPKQYCVRPNSGRVEPGKHVEVTVLLQAMKAEPPLDAKCKDKFLVQSVPISPEHEFANPGAVWQDDIDRSLIQEKKIRVIYLAADGTGASSMSTPLRSNMSDSQPSEAPPQYRSPSPEEHFTPDTRRSNNVAPSVKSEDSTTAPAASGIKDTAASVVAAAPTYEEIKAKLAEAQATIAGYAQDGGLRLRKVANGETENATVNEIAHKVQNSQGVPVQIVAALCFLSFLLAYFFF